MNKNKLFPQINGILHGGDYNAEQWLDRPDILAKDIEMMKEAGMTSATLGVFSWSAYEPAEGEYHFDWLKDVMDNLYNAGISRNTIWWQTGMDGAEISRDQTCGFL